MKLEDFGTRRYGSDRLNVTFDPTVAGEFASYAFDDEGAAPGALRRRAGREQRGEKHAGIEAEARRETRQSMRIRREHTGRWRTCDGELEAWLAAA